MRSSLRSEHPDATAALGAAVAQLLGPGDVVVLSGPLGAGKTRFVQGLAAGLGVPGRVTSPTFVLVRRHTGRIPLVHVDAYRLEDAADLVTLDDDVLADDLVTCIEWGGNVADALPAQRLDVAIAVDGDVGDAPRTLTIVARGAAWEARASALHTALETLAALTPMLEVGRDDA
jgi:tRNA threonylcarbamoyladenosine biosynthesis protein TsaE